MAEQQNISAKSNWQKKFLPVLGGAIIIALVVGGYFGWQFITSKIDTSETKVDKFLIEIKQLQTKTDQLQNVVQDLQKEVQKANVARAKEWKPLVIEHLIRMANLTLNTTRDTKLAIAFLLAAQQYATGIELSAVNHALNRDISSLQTVPIVESEVLILKIEALSQKIESLQLVNQKFANSQEKKPEKVAYVKTLWKRFFVSTVNALKDVVTIRRQNVEVPLLPEQEINLRLILQTKLLQAELAVTHRQNKLYQACLEQVGNLVTRYFTANSQAAKDIFPLIQELQQVDLEPKLPLLSSSIAAITDFINSSNIEENQPQLKSPPQPQTPPTDRAKLL